jgi:hypothetical protein
MMLIILKQVLLVVSRYMIKQLLTALAALSAIALCAQPAPGPWIPAGSDLSFPRGIIHSSEINSVKNALAAGVNLDLYNEVYTHAISAPPANNDDIASKSTRAGQAKNAAFCLLLGVKPVAGNIYALTSGEKDLLRNRAVNLLENINTYINQFSTDSPGNYDLWQWSSKEMIDYTSAYDLLRGSGMTAAELTAARNRLKEFVGNLYYESTKTTLGGSFFQGAKNNHALMSAGAIGFAAVILSDLTDTAEKYKPLNWINAAMWNIHNVMWWDIKRQSVPGVDAGYAEGSYYFKYAFCNLLPFIRAMGVYLPDTSLTYNFLGIYRKIRNPWYDTNYNRVYDWMRTLLMPDGRMPPLEDSYVYRGFPELAILRNPRYNWPLHLSQLDPAQYNTLSLQLQSVYDMRANYIAANVTPTAPDEPLFKVLPEAGAAIFRSGSDSNATYLALTGKHGTALNSADAHNHADDGSILMMVRGQTMALDPGYLSYLLRDTVANAAAHNTLLVNGKGPDFGVPGKSGGAPSYLEKEFTSSVVDYAELRTNFSETDINRKVIFVRKDYFLVADHLQSQSPFSATFLLHGYGLDGGDLNYTGIFTDLLAARRAMWRRKNSMLYAAITSERPLTLTAKTGLHEYNYQNIQNHTYLDATSESASSVSFLTCLQGGATPSDTFPVEQITIPGATGWRVKKDDYTDVAINRGTSTLAAYSASATGLPVKYTTDGALLWSSVRAGKTEDLFVYKATVLLSESDTIFTSPHAINLCYVQTGTTLFGGFCGDTGWVTFHTGAYPIRITSNGTWFSDYDAARKVAHVYFGKPAYFEIELDDMRTGFGREVRHAGALTCMPVPADNRIVFSGADGLLAEGSIAVTDLSGREVKRVETEDAAARVEMQVADLNPGAYIATFTGRRGEHTARCRFVVTR